ncbi:prepilin-type N-terminal cleavage/methylation domain-containing protein [Candidatus Nomurabacteria bacterium]|nr:prepilin-type N-terminal cleavage/methylation domain-containing protein [Candidatus Nomurabacteria bacterium]
MINFKKGLSLIEIIMVVAVLGIILTISVPGFVNFRKNQSIQNTTNSVVSLLEEARARTLASYNNTFYSVRIESNRAILFTGGTYSSSSPTNKTVPFESPVVLQSISLSGGGSEIKFDRIKGTTSQYGTIVLQIPSGTSRTITINSGGVITRD